MYSDSSTGTSVTTTADRLIETLKQVIEEISSPEYSVLLVYKDDFIIDLAFLNDGELKLCSECYEKDKSLWLCCGEKRIQLNNCYMKFKYFQTLISFKEMQLECTFDLTVDDAARSALDKYISIGEMIRSARSKRFRAITDLIVNFDQSSYIISELKPSKVEDPKKMFIAVVAPEQSGKTQLAFSVIEKKPLYFVREKDEYDRPIPDAQHIYQNFTKMTDKFMEFAKADIKSLPSYNVINISKSELLESYNVDRKFKSLGFLYALMLESTAKYVDTAVPWMKFYADRSIGGRETLHFTAKSINDCKNDPLFAQFTRQFFIFLDEFPLDSPRSLFLRNMCCALEFTCVIASTNTQVIEAGITLKDDRGSNTCNHIMRPDDTTVWCTVVTKVCFPNVGFDSDFDGVKQKFQKIAEAASSSEVAKMTMLIGFFESQLKVSRPGIAAKIMEYMKEAANRFESSRDTPAFDILEHVLKCLSESLKESTRETIWGTTFMFYANSFVANLSNGMSDFVHAHAYYLQNPVTDSNYCMYLLWRHHGAETINSHKFDFSVSKAGRRERQIHWFKSMFESREILLIMSYYMKKSNMSMTYIFEWADCERRRNKIYAFGDVFGGWDYGHRLTNITVASCIQSSHQSSLNGSDGIDFLTQLLRNFNQCYLPERTYKLFFVGDDHIEGILKSFHFPFFYVADVQCPAPLKAIANCGSILRNENEKYDILVDCERANQAGKAIFDCKDLFRPLIANQIIQIVNGAAEQSDLKIHFTVCNSLGRHLVKYESDYNLMCLGELVEKNRYNIYKFKQIELPATSALNHSYQLIPYCPEFKHYEDPKLVFIIIDLKEVNRR